MNDPTNASTNSAKDEAAANRRPLTSRSSGWAKATAALLVRMNVSPNAISVISILFAAMGAAAFVYLQSPLGLVLAAICVQLRLLCNLFDGMVAIEGGRQSAVGGLYNEIPDRIADSLFIVAMAYSIGEPTLGWFGALAAAITAYVRTLGASLKLAHDFRGPMAKPHRMAVITAASVLGAIELWLNQSHWALLTAAWIIAVGSVLTCGTRTLAIAKQLKAMHAQS